MSRTLLAECLCLNVRLTITVPLADLPLPVHLCHCSICRTTQGGLCCVHAALPDGLAPRFIAPSSRDSMTGYVHARAGCQRFFCKVCGCHVGDEDIPGKNPTRPVSWRLSSSLFEAGLHDAGADQAFRFASQLMPQDGPNGLHQWLTHVNGKPIPTIQPASDDPLFPLAGEPYEPAEPAYDKHGREILRAGCHCGGISFYITRPHQSRLASPVHADHWVATFDACMNCRLVTGVHFVPWAFVPLANIHPPPDLQMDKPAQGTEGRRGEPYVRPADADTAGPAPLGHYTTLQVYKYTKDASRGFCRVCGATAFFTTRDRLVYPTEQGGPFVDVAVGLLRAPEGVDCRRWLDWRTGRVSFETSGEFFDPAALKSLQSGLAAWGAQVYGRDEPADWHMTPEGWKRGQRWMH